MRARPRAGRSLSGKPRLSPDVRKNRESWERGARAYEAKHRSALHREQGMAWGLWRVPESELRLLGPVRGKRILELGCGAAQWSVGLAMKGAHVTGVDVSPRRLAQARQEMKRSGVDFPLIEASAEAVPLPARSFDIVFCDWGAMTFCDPFRTIPEVSRLLRPGGVFVFSNSSVFRSLCQDRRTDRIGPRLRYGYFGLHRIAFRDEVDFQLPFSGWIRLFRKNGLAIEDLVETRPSPGATSSYLGRGETAWARHWPLEVIWKLRRGDRRPPRPSHGRPSLGTVARPVFSPNR